MSERQRNTSSTLQLPTCTKNVVTTHNTSTGVHINYIGRDVLSFFSLFRSICSNRAKLRESQGNQPRAEGIRAERFWLHHVVVQAQGDSTLGDLFCIKHSFGASNFLMFVFSLIFDYPAAT